MFSRYRIAFSLATAMIAGGALTASASTHHARPAASAASDSATGCLQKGDKPGTFKLVSKDGKSWDVMSTKMALAPHVGHEVTLSGDTKMMDKMSGMKDTSMSKMGMKDSSMSKMSGMSSGSMNVTGMSMVAATCS